MGVRNHLGWLFAADNQNANDLTEGGNRTDSFLTTVCSAFWGSCDEAKFPSKPGRKKQQMQL